MKIIRLNIILVFAFITVTGFAQTKTIDKTFKTSNNVSLHINSSHTNIEVDYWDRNEVKVEGIMENQGVDEETRQKMKNEWTPEIKASAGKIEITSHAGGMTNFEMPDLSGLEQPLSQLPEMLGPLMNDFVGPLLENISKNPLPPEFSEKMGNLKFDYEAYRRDGDEYLEKFEKEVEGNFDEDFEKSMEEWALNMEKDSAMWKNFEMEMEEWGESFGKNMEAWGENFGKEMEVWGESFGKDMEKWAEQFEAEMEAEGGHPKNIGVFRNKDGGAKKTLKLTVPKNASFDLRVRHGEIMLNGKTTNLKADLSHGNFSAANISGKDTRVKISYSPVTIENWDYGVLDARHVKDFSIEKARSIKLNSQSSDIVFQEITETGILSGSFGKLKIGKLQPGFKMLDVSLENSDMELSLPNSAYSFSYNGTRSKIKTPDVLNLKSSSSYDNESLTGYRGSKEANSTVNIKASFSDILVN